MNQSQPAALTLAERADALEAARWLVTGVVPDLSTQSVALMARYLLELLAQRAGSVDQPKKADQPEPEAAREPRVLHALPRGR